MANSIIEKVGFASSESVNNLSSITTKSFVDDPPALESFVNELPIPVMGSREAGSVADAGDEPDFTLDAH